MASPPAARRIRSSTARTASILAPREASSSFAYKTDPISSRRPRRGSSRMLIRGMVCGMGRSGVQSRPAAGLSRVAPGLLSRGATQPSLGGVHDGPGQGRDRSPACGVRIDPVTTWQLLGPIHQISYTRGVSSSYVTAGEQSHRHAADTATAPGTAWCDQEEGQHTPDGLPYRPALGHSPHARDRAAGVWARHLPLWRIGSVPCTRGVPADGRTLPLCPTCEAVATRTPTSTVTPTATRETATPNIGATATAACGTFLEQFPGTPCPP